MENTNVRIIISTLRPKPELALRSHTSKYGIGAVILHYYNECNIKVVANASRSLQQIEEQYSQIEKEALPIIFAGRKFHKFINVRSFVYRQTTSIINLCLKKKGNTYVRS